MQYFSASAIVALLASTSFAAPTSPNNTIPNGGSPNYKISNFIATASPNSIFNYYSFNITYIASQTFAHPSQIFDVCTGSIATSGNVDQLATTGIEACHEEVWDLHWAFFSAEQDGCKGYKLAVEDPQGYTGTHFFDGRDVIQVGGSSPADACCSLNTGADGASFEIERVPGRIQYV